MKKRCNAKGWKKEQKEHPSFSKKQVKRIACDHNKLKKYKSSRL